MLLFWTTVWLRNVKAGVLLLLWLAIMSIVLGVQLPAPGLSPFIAMGLWWVGLIAAVAWFCTWAFRARMKALGRNSNEAESAAAFIEEIFINLLGVLAAGPLAAFLLAQQLTHGPELSDPVLWFAVVAAILSAQSAYRMWRHVTGRALEE